MKRALFEIVDMVREADDQKEKVRILRENASPQLIKLLKIATDKRVTWYLPEGAPPFTPLRDAGAEEMLYMQVFKLYVYCSDPDKPSPLAPSPDDDPRRKNFKESRLQQNFKELLESVHPEDAALIIAVKDKKLGVTAQIVKKAFG